MLNTSNFIKSIDNVFWKQLTKDCIFKDVIDYQDIEKNSFLERLALDINKYRYCFSIPDYYYQPKGNGVVRKIKNYSLADTCLYYYCVKNIQDELVEIIKSVENVFGGFRFTPPLKLKQEYIDKLNYDPIYDSVLNKSAYRKDWSDYHNLANALYKKEYSLYIHVDIAHFYDDINLTLLEKDIRSNVNCKSEIIDLLFYFLRNSDKKDLSYNSSDVGIPQEEIGEMSRLLANFYLNSFDLAVNSALAKYFNSTSDWVYTRYADDMWLCINGDLSDAQRVVQLVSLQLQKKKLHINEGKLKFLSAKEFISYWYFDEWDKINLKKKDIRALIKVHKRLTSEKEKKKNGRWYSPANYIYQILIGDVNNVKLITAKDASYFVSYLLHNPKQLVRSKEHTFKFFNALFKEFPPLLQEIVSFLESKENLNPSIEYFWIAFLCTNWCAEGDLEYICKYYRASFKGDAKWFIRCMCIKFFSKYLDALEKKFPDELDYIINQIKNTLSSQRQRERRYSIYFLSKLPHNRGNDIIDESFPTTEDQILRNSLKALKPIVKSKPRKVMIPQEEVDVPIA